MHVQAFVLLMTSVQMLADICICAIGRAYVTRVCKPYQGYKAKVVHSCYSLDLGGGEKLLSADTA